MGRLTSLVRRSAVSLVCGLSLLTACAGIPDATRQIDLSGAGWTADGVAVSVPHTWNAADGADGPAGERTAENSSLDLKTGYARKAVVYRRTLPDPRPGRRQFLRVEAASLVATVRVNGWTVGVHKGAFTAFCLEITKQLKPDGNVLEITVDNRRDPDVAPLTGDFTLQGGLYRKVWLIETPAVCIDRTIDGGPGVELDIRPDGHVTAKAHVLGGADVTREFRFPNPVLWTPETPKLYEVTVELESGDRVTVPFGFRTAELRADGFYLNGQRRVLHGVNRHQDVGDRGWAADADDEARDVALIREIGANAVRTAHYPQSDNIYRLFDEAGILVWCEVPFVSRCTYSDAFEANLRDQYREMVAQLGHHPSIVFWSAWNEVNPRKDGRCVPLVRRFCEWARTVDPTRPMSAASALVEGFSDLNATLSGTVAFNRYPGWYDRDVDWFRNQMDEIFRCNPGLTTTAITEYGGGASVRQHGDPLGVCRERGPHHEEYQAYLHSRVYRHMLADERLWGTFVWAMFDFASDARREGDREGINDKGLVTRDRLMRKDSFYLYKANWTKEPVLHLVGRRMTEVVSNRVNVVVFGNCGDVALSVNGTRIGVRTPDEAKTVIFRDVLLARGANDIRVTSKDLVERVTWTVR